jgi:hypothetical protein
MAKATKAEAQYTDVAKGTRHCGGCAHFRDGRCAIVAGNVKPGGVCRYYKAKK